MSVADYINNFTLADHPECVVEIAEHLSILPYVQHFIKHHAGDIDAYHGKLHSVATMLNCYEGAMNTVEGKDRSNLIAITLAGLYHDADHLKGTQNSDKENIVLAVKFFNDFHSTLPLSQAVGEEEHAKVVDFIKSTQYPYTRKAPKTQMHAIIRDADLMSIYLANPESKRRLFDGLYGEILIWRKMQYLGGMDRLQWGLNQQAFWSNMGWSSRYGKMKSITRNAPERIKEWVALA